MINSNDIDLKPSFKMEGFVPNSYHLAEGLYMYGNKVSESINRY
jgi:hypothetical protein